MSQFNQWLRNFGEGFVNLLRIFRIPLVLSLVIASGYTTYLGMVNFIDTFIALTVTVAVQIIIVLSSYELAKSNFKIQKGRFIGFLISLLLGLIVSANFTYITFFNNSNSQKVKKEEFEKLDTMLWEYRQKVNSKKSELIAELNNAINEKKKERDEEGREGKLSGIPGFGKVYDAFDKEYKELLSDKEQKLGQLKIIDSTMNRFFSSWNYDNLKSSKNNSKLLDLYTKMIQVNENTFSDLGDNLTVQPPQLINPEELKEVKGIPPYAIVNQLPLYLALVLDFLIFLISTRLDILPIGELSDAELEFVFQKIFQISAVDINDNNHFQIEIDACNNNQKYAISLLLHKGYLHRVDKNLVESTPKFFDVVDRKLNKRKSLQNEYTLQRRYKLRNHFGL